MRLTMEGTEARFVSPRYLERESIANIWLRIVGFATASRIFGLKFAKFGASNLTWMEGEAAGFCVAGFSTATDFRLENCGGGGFCCFLTIKV